MGQNVSNASTPGATCQNPVAASACDAGQGDGSGTVGQCGKCEGNSPRYTSRQYAFPGTAEAGHINVQGSTKVGSNLEVIGSLTLGGASRTSWPEGKVYSGEANQLTVNNTTNKIGFVSLPLMNNLMVGNTFSNYTLFADNSSRQLRVGSSEPPALMVNANDNTVSIGGAPDTSRRLTVHGSAALKDDLYLNSGKAFRVDQSNATTTLDIGNYATGGQGIWLRLHGKLSVGDATLPTDANFSRDITVKQDVYLTDNRSLFVNATNQKTKLNIQNTGVNSQDDGVRVNIGVSGKAGELDVNGPAAFGNHEPSATWKLTTPNLYVGDGTKGTIIGAGADQSAGDIKADGRLIVAGELKRLQPGTSDCPTNTVWIDFNGNGTKQDVECYDAPDNTSQGQGIGVFGGRLYTEGGLTVSGSTMISGSTTITPTVDSTISPQYALRVVDTNNNEWFSVKRTGSVGNATVDANTIHITTLGTLTAAKLGTSSRFNTPLLFVNNENGQVSSLNEVVNIKGNTLLDGKLQVKDDLILEKELKVPKLHLGTVASGDYHIVADEQPLRINASVQLNGLLKISSQIKDDNNNEIVDADGKLRMYRMAGFDFNSAQKGYFPILAPPGTNTLPTNCSNVCQLHGLSCITNYGVVKFNVSNGQVNGQVSATTCSDNSGMRLCPCGG